MTVAERSRCTEGRLSTVDYVPEVLRKGFARRNNWILFDFSVKSGSRDEREHRNKLEIILQNLAQKFGSPTSNFCPGSPRGGSNSTASFSQARPALLS